MFDSWLLCFHINQVYWSEYITYGSVTPLYLYWDKMFQNSPIFLPCTCTHIILWICFKAEKFTTKFSCYHSTSKILALKNFRLYNIPLYFHDESNSVTLMCLINEFNNIFIYKHLQCWPQIWPTTDCSHGYKIINHTHTKPLYNL